jgi:two-component system, cell cycle sensor histidine kinase and response regulator CckA
MSSAPPHPDRPLVLVVDDQLPVRVVIARSLTEAGYDVLTAPDGQAATTVIQMLRTPPDLVLTDLRMPVMRGEALATWLAAHYPQVPVVFISGFGSYDAEEIPGPVLAKPFTHEGLCAVVAAAIRRPAPDRTSISA